jgi:hypothetical protein
MRYEICFCCRRFHVADENFALEKLQRFLKSQDVWNPFTVLQKTVTFPVVTLGILWAIPIGVLSWSSSITLLSLHKELGSTPKSYESFLSLCEELRSTPKSYKSFLFSHEELRSTPKGLQVLLVFAQGAKEHTQGLQVFLIFA